MAWGAGHLNGWYVLIRRAVRGRRAAPGSQEVRVPQVVDPVPQEVDSALQAAADSALQGVEQAPQAGLVVPVVDLALQVVADSALQVGLVVPGSQGAVQVPQGALVVPVPRAAGLALPVGAQVARDLLAAQAHPEGVPVAPAAEQAPQVAGSVLQVAA